MTTLTFNKYGSNQYKVDPRQYFCWKIYSTPGTKYFSNAYRSAIVAGYSPSTARVINNRKWLYEKVRKMNLLELSESYIDKLFDTRHIVPIQGKNGLMRDSSTGEILYKIDEDIFKEKAEMAMFICKKFGKHLR